MREITSALKPFHICPRCSKFQWKRDSCCKSCDFEIAGWGCDDRRQACFSTGKYHIIQNKNLITGHAHCYISSKECTREYDEFDPTDYYDRPKIRVEFDVEVSLRATDEDIEKVLLLM